MQEINTIESEKAIMRAIASTYVNHKKDVIKCIKKHKRINKDISKSEILNIILIELSKNPAFAKDFVNLMIKKGKLKTTEYGYRNFIGAIMGAVTAVAGVAGKAVGVKKARLEGENQSKQQRIDAENQMMQMIADAENNKAKKQQTTTIIMVVALVLVTGLAGLVIYNKTK